MSGKKLLKNACWMLAIAAAFVMGPAAQAQAQEVDPVGHWAIDVNMGGTPMKASLDVTRNDDGSFGGTLISPMGNLSLDNVELKDGETLSFAETVGEGDTAMEFSFEGTFTSPDTFEGTLTTSMGPMDVKGTRVIPPPAIAGIWDVSSDSQAGPLERELIVYKSWKGKYVGDAEWQISDLAEDGANVSFAVTVEIQGQELPLEFKGTLDGDSIEGEFFADGNSVSNVTATRSEKGGLPAFAGSWELNADTPLGELAAKLEVGADGSGTMKTDEGESPISDLKFDADMVEFGVTVPFEGEEYEVVFEGTLNGDTLTGDFIMGGSPVATVQMARGS